MERNYTFTLIIISFLLTNVVAYLDEGIRTFDYLMRFSDWVALIIYTTLFLAIPFLIFFLVKKNEKKRFILALFGFVPVIILIVLQTGITY
ncbi:MAG: hypothetical protein KDD03_01370 [Gelidibacter sp.]|nr:hypothetical protein [Gelidibacter sp.]